MNRICFLAVIFSTGLYSQAHAQFGRTTTAVGTTQRSIVTQTSAGVSAPGGAANPTLGQGTTGATTFIAPTTPTSLVTPTTPTATVTVTPAVTTVNGVVTPSTVVSPNVNTFVTPTTGIQTGNATPLTSVPTQTGGTIVSGTVLDPSLVPPLKNKVDIFGRIVGTEVNPAAVAASANGVGTTVGGTVVGGTVGTVVPVSVAQSVVTPGNTQVTIMLQGTVASQTDRQAVLNRFQGLPGFVVVDQLQVVGTTTPVTTTPSQAVVNTVTADTGTPQSIFVGGLTSP